RNREVIGRELSAGTSVFAQAGSGVIRELPGEDRGMRRGDGEVSRKPAARDRRGTAGAAVQGEAEPDELQRAGTRVQAGGGGSVSNPRVEFRDSATDCVGSGSGLEGVSKREAFRQLVVSESEPPSLGRKGLIEQDQSEQQSGGGGVSSGGGECEGKPERVGG